jgi:Na+/H+-dicarboxylate symporter
LEEENEGSGDYPTLPSYQKDNGNMSSSAKYGKKAKGGGVITDEDVLLETPNSKTRIFKRILNFCKGNVLLILTVLGVVLGLIVGITLNRVGGISATAVKLIGFPGELLLRMLKMLVLPLVMASIIVGITSFSFKGTNLKAEKRLFYRLAAYFSGTTVTAVIIGIIFVSVIQPGALHNGTTKPIDGPNDGDHPIPSNISTLDSVLGVFKNMVPDNIVKAAADMDILGIITFSMLLGGTIMAVGDKGEPLLKIFQSLNEVIMKMVMLVMWYAPFGILSLIAARLAEKENFFHVLRDLGLFAGTVIVGLLVHLFVVLPLLYFIFVRRNPFKFYWGMLQACFTALGTDSSAATMPITMKCCIELGVSEKIAQIVLPLGITLNMNGTALYEAVAAMFVAQLNGIELNLGQTIVIALTATLAAVGAAGIPEAGLVTMTIVFSAVGLPLEDIGILLTIDWFLDRLRTVVNVMGDAVGAGIADKYYRQETSTSYEPLE